MIIFFKKNQKEKKSILLVKISNYKDECPYFPIINSQCLIKVITLYSKYTKLEMFT